MGTRFELVLYGDTDPVRLRSAGEEALDEVERLERQLSFYRPESDISRINRLAAAAPVRVEPRLFALLQRAIHLARQTQGTFDPTIGPLLREWGFIGGRGRQAKPLGVEGARQRTGWQKLLLDPAECTVGFACAGMELDLGAIGKGYAIDRALDVLVDCGVTSALIHGGASTVGALGSPPGLDGWPVLVAHPGQDRAAASISITTGICLSVSALHEKSFQGADGQLHGHILDPRTGTPVTGARLTAVAAPTAEVSDALSTALMVNGAASEVPPGLHALAIDASGERMQWGSAFTAVPPDPL